MRVRHLSPTTFWVEILLTAQTPQFLWRAMNECGLVRGKINSASTTHFVLPPSQQPYIVQGLTPPGLFAENVLVQAYLLPMDGGTCVQLDAANARSDFDFGTSSRLKRKYAARLEKFFSLTPDNWMQQVENEAPQKQAPIASPTAQGIVKKHEIPEFEALRAFDHTASYGQVRLVLFIGGTSLLTHVQPLAPLVLLLWACWMLWEWHQMRRVVWWEAVSLAGWTVFEMGRYFI